MRKLLLAAGLVSTLLLTACVTNSNLQVPEEMLECTEEVQIPDGRLTDNQIAELIVRLDARGDVCAERLEALRSWLGSRGAVLRTQRKAM